MRVIVTPVGLFGVCMLCLGPFLLYQSCSEQNPWLIVLAVVPMTLGAYFLYVAYLVWFRFSSLAVRHICGILGFYVLGCVTTLFDPAHDSYRHWTGFAYLGCLVVVYFAYRFASDRLSRLLFPESISGVQP
jgi:hypothetical protein